MTLRHASLASLLALTSFGLGCSSDPVATDAGTDTPIATDTPADVSATDAPRTDVPATDVPATDVPAMDAATDATADATPTTDTATDTTPTDVAPTDGGAETLYVATLSSAEEVPTNRSTATGTAQVFLNSARNSIRYVVRHTVTGATAAHIHLGMAGQNGGVAITLSGSGADITGTAAVTPEQATALDEDRWYFNVHSAANAGGEIRGQVLHTGETLYVAQLTGDQEVPVAATVQTGIGSLIVSSDRTTLRYRVQSMLMPSAAHVHTGPGGVAGGVAFGLSPLGNTIVGVQPVTPAITLADLERGRWYFNLHTATFAGGEIRGQILRPGEVLLTTQLAGSSEVPAVVTTGAGSVAGILTADRTRLLVDGSYTNLAAVSAAHLHSAVAGMNGGVAFPLTATAAALNGTLTANLTLATSATAGFLDALLSGGIYVNVHTAANAGGEVRGQLVRRTP